MQQILDHGHVELLANPWGGDLAVANAARVSFASRFDELDERGEGLIGFLMRERHGTPFEHGTFTFDIKAPIFVAREWQRHRIGSFNEQSGRYSKLKAEFYVPAAGDMRTQVGKPGAYTFEPMEPEHAAATADEMAGIMRECFDSYALMLANGVAKEVARMVLPVATYTEFWWTVNPRALMNFLSLRTAETAQAEIRRYAIEIEVLFRAAMPVTHAAWVANGRIAP